MESNEQSFKFRLAAVQRQQEWELDERRAHLRILDTQRVDLSRESAALRAGIAEEQAAFRAGAASIGSNLVARWSLLNLYTRVQVGKVVAAEKQLESIELDRAEQTVALCESMARLKALENLRRRQAEAHERGRLTSSDRQGEEAWRSLAARRSRTGKPGHGT